MQKKILAVKLEAEKKRHREISKKWRKNPGRFSREIREIEKKIRETKKILFLETAPEKYKNYKRKKYKKTINKIIDRTLTYFNATKQEKIKMKKFVLEDIVIVPSKEFKKHFANVFGVFYPKNLIQSISFKPKIRETNRGFIILKESSIKKEKTITALEHELVHYFRRILGITENEVVPYAFTTKTRLKKTKTRKEILENRKKLKRFLLKRRENWQYYRQAMLGQIAGSTAHQLKMDYGPKTANEFLKIIANQENVTRKTIEQAKQKAIKNTKNTT